MQSKRIRVLTLTNATFIATLAGMAQGQNFEWATPASGLWNTAANWDPQTVPNSFLHTAVLGYETPYTVSLNTNISLGSLAIPNPNARFEVQAGRNALLNGPISGPGTVVVNQSGADSTSFIRFDSNSTLSGGGEIVLNSFFNNFSRAYLNTLNNTVVTIGPDYTIRGLGRIYGRYIHAGSIISDDLFGGEIQLITSQMTRSGQGDILLQGGQFYIQDSTLTGVPITASGSEGVRTGGTVTLNNVAAQADVTVSTGTLNANNLVMTGDLQVNQARAMVVTSPDLTVEGDILINHTGGASNTFLQFNQTGSLLGAGVLTLNANQANLDTAYLNTVNNAVVTIPAGRTVAGSGRLYGSYVLAGDIRPSGGLQLLNGQMTGVDGGQILLENSDFFLSNTTMSGVPVAGTGTGSIKTDNTVTLNNVEAQADVTVSTGTLNANNLVMTGDLQVNQARAMVVTSPDLTVEGDILINHTGGASNTFLQFNQTATLLGEGALILNANLANYDTAYVQATNNAVLTIGENRTVKGSGRVYGSVVIEGGVAPEVIGAASTSSIDFRNQTVFNDAALIDIEVGGPEVQDRDRLIGPGTKQLDGTLRVRTLNDYVPVRGTVFSVITGNVVTGRFHTLDVPSLWSVAYSPTAVNLVYDCNADFNADGQINFFDVQEFLGAFSANDQSADLVDDDVFNFFDVQAFLGLFSAGCP